MADSSEDLNKKYDEHYRRMRGHSQNEGRSQSIYNSGGKPNDGRKPPGCFSAGTQILTPTGERDIACLQAGDLVISLSSDGRPQAQRILRRRVHPEAKLWMLTFVDGTVIRTTWAHSFLTQDGWKQAKNLITHDMVYAVGQTSRSTKEIRRSSSSENHETVYNLVVENDFTFIANGVIVHSFSYARTLRCLLWRVFAVLLNSTNLWRPTLGQFLSPQ